MRRSMMIAGGGDRGPFPFEWTAATTPFPTTLAYGRAVTLPDGRVMTVGGSTSTAASNATNTVRFGTVSGNSIAWAIGTSIPSNRISGSLAVLADGRVAYFGGQNQSAVNQSTVYLGAISGNTVSWSTGTAIPSTSFETVALLLADGRILLAGNRSSTVRFATFSGNTISWATGTALTSAYSGGCYPQGYVRDSGVNVVLCGAGSSENITLKGSISGDVISWTTGAPISAVNRTASKRKDKLVLTYQTGDGDEWVDGDTPPFSLSERGMQVTLLDGRVLSMAGGSTLTTDCWFGVS